MRYYRCKCGQLESWGTMRPPQCSWCEACQSNPAETPDTHRTERTPHKWYQEKVDTDAGEAELTRCVYCGHTRKELEAAAQKESK